MRIPFEKEVISMSYTSIKVPPGMLFYLRCWWEWKSFSGGEAKLFQLRQTLIAAKVFCRKRRGWRHLRVPTFLNQARSARSRTASLMTLFDSLLRASSTNNYLSRNQISLREHKRKLMVKAWNYTARGKLNFRLLPSPASPSGLPKIYLSSPKQ
jgi:hypothetical protein